VPRSRRRADGAIPTNWKRHQASGDVYHLQSLQDFSGHYTVASAGVTVAGGGAVAVLRNEHGVLIKLRESTAGLRFNFASEGVRIKLKS
jgi:hypothetical protein